MYICVCLCVLQNNKQNLAKTKTKTKWFYANSRGHFVLLLFCSCFALTQWQRNLVFIKGLYHPSFLSRRLFSLSFSSRFPSLLSLFCLSVVLYQVFFFSFFCFFLKDVSVDTLQTPHSLVYQSVRSGRDQEPASGVSAVHVFDVLLLDMRPYMLILISI